MKTSEIVLIATLTVLSSTIPVHAEDGDLGNGNTAEGTGALFSITTGAQNTAMGYQALYSATALSYDTAVGYQALHTETALTGPDNPSYNTAIGWHALFSNSVGANRNTAVGAVSLESNTTGYQNTAVGQAALANNTTGNANTAIGFPALLHNTTGNGNTAVGDTALNDQNDGSYNTAIGSFAFQSGHGNFNIAVGSAAGTNVAGDNNIDLASPGSGSDANTIRIGNATAFTDAQGLSHPAHTAAFVAGVYGVDKSGGQPVFVDGNGQLGTGSLPATWTSGSVLLMQPGSTPPPGFTKIGTTTVSYKNLAGKNQNASLDIYQKN